MEGLVIDGTLRHRSIGVHPNEWPFSMNTPLLLPLLLVTGLPPFARTAVAQELAPDSGTFTLTRNGKEIGRETFSIQRTGSGADMRIVATATTELRSASGTIKMSSRLGASGAGAVISGYQIKVSGAVEEEVRITTSGRRFQAYIETGRGEEVREFRASPNAILLDEGVSYLYALLGPRSVGGHASVPVLMPRSGKRLMMTLSTPVSETTRIAGRTVEARKVTLEGEGEVYQVWLDDRGRLLRVEVPSSGFRAERTNLPR